MKENNLRYILSLLPCLVLGPMSCSDETVSTGDPAASEPDAVGTDSGSSDEVPDAAADEDGSANGDGSGAGGSDGGGGGGTGTLTWNGEIGPMLQTNCGGCHFDGGSADFDLLTYESAARFAPAALGAMQSGRMPPWPPADDCRDYLNERNMPAADIARFAEWYNAGMPVGEGDARTFEPNPTVTLPPDLTADMPEAYTPVATLDDDYRCFILDLDFPADTWIEGVDVDAGTSQVHHVLVYAMSGETLAAATAADAAEDGPGYTCFGGPNPTRGGAGSEASNLSNIQVGAWVPGMDASRLPTDTAQLIPASSRLVMQVHYNTIGGPVVPDQSSIVLQTRDSPPAFTWRTLPIAQPQLSIPAGDADSVQSITITHRGNGPITIASSAHHMHTLGYAIRSWITRSDATEECLLDVPAWDFQWQMQYFFPEGSFAVVQPGDSITLECRYNNSAANQPVVDGVQIEPRDVRWGEGTFDEMCLTYLGVVAPYVAPPADDSGECSAAADCAEQCDPLTTECFFTCDGANAQCLTCAARSLVGCGAAACGLQLQSARACLAPCAVGGNAFGGSIGACMQATCPDTWTELTECLDPFLERPACQTALETCGL
jgi:hypothetical protein